MREVSLWNDCILRRRTGSFGCTPLPSLPPLLSGFSNSRQFRCFPRGQIWTADRQGKVDGLLERRRAYWLRWTGCSRQSLDPIPGLDQDTVYGTKLSLTYTYMTFLGSREQITGDGVCVKEQWHTGTAAGPKRRLRVRLIWNYTGTLFSITFCLASEFRSWVWLGRRREKKKSMCSDGNACGRPVKWLGATRTGDERRPAQGFGWLVAGLAMEDDAAWGCEMKQDRQVHDVSVAADEALGWGLYRGVRVVRYRSLVQVPLEVHRELCSIVGAQRDTLNLGSMQCFLSSLHVFTTG